ncbi:TPA: hypothetical protein DCX66_03490 [Candidatus Nomurabacteria bacterium]|uniref:Uncharacterized protein n=1 Tax=Candidatus Nomurabacteria bacterium GW2011_GWE1_35_16 TaxID=1618761 RepID=A0A0G0BBU6_9BACT|nr:MAG: hypothetical protein UR55_C0001G0052 [Candidatus Nomurabacteria bacterium GW2011_GWF1_34_20]KKP63761.1 MAG: hypothetical protein UR57_C0001G0052 [Candidatus Nomurabacteria bacterium GW2011_GWE2_34_25]KKP66973.1 MAG: hypothetical protein UR64_C0001G0052 [Candidatus Nomurabacteria bacterium GW2011_GWE1_35_16]HAE36795.1 hypothetical protein [Candidatus Nomurabacteria bacterium]HAX65502.1 hypothetical protein [Candidatus Nomurabacteria bacterium]
MRTYIKNLQKKEEGKRKQIFAGAMIVSMFFVGVIWIYGLGVRFGNPEVKEKTREDIKPFKLFSNSLSDTYSNVSASVGKASSKDTVKTETEQKDEKQIDLMPIEYSNQ